jgi:hypothetical protein
MNAGRVRRGRAGSPRSGSRRHGLTSVLDAASSSQHLQVGRSARRAHHELVYPRAPRRAGARPSRRGAKGSSSPEREWIPADAEVHLDALKQRLPREPARHLHRKPSSPKKAFPTASTRAGGGVRREPRTGTDGRARSIRKSRSGRDRLQARVDLAQVDCSGRPSSRRGEVCPAPRPHGPGLRRARRSGVFAAKLRRRHARSRYTTRRSRQTGESVRCRHDVLEAKEVPRRECAAAGGGRGVPSAQAANAAEKESRSRSIISAREDRADG